MVVDLEISHASSYCLAFQRFLDLLKLQLLGLTDLRPVHLLYLLSVAVGFIKTLFLFLIHQLLLLLRLLYQGVVQSIWLVS
jgi:hypothetical protein